MIIYMPIEEALQYMEAAICTKPVSVRARRIAKAGGIRAAKTRQYRQRYAVSQYDSLSREYMMHHRYAYLYNLDLDALLDEAWQLLYDGWLATAGTASDAAFWEACRAREDS